VILIPEIYSVIGAVIGKKGSTIREITMESGCKIGQELEPCLLEDCGLRTFVVSGPMENALRGIRAVLSTVESALHNIGKTYDKLETQFPKEALGK